MKSKSPTISTISTSPISPTSPIQIPINSPQTVALAIVGDPLVGKFKLFNNITHQSTNNNSLFPFYSLLKPPNFNIDIQLLNGHPSLDRLRPTYYLYSKLFILSYSSYSSLDSIVNHWIPDILHYQPCAQFILVAIDSNLILDFPLPSIIHNHIHVNTVNNTGISQLWDMILLSRTFFKIPTCNLDTSSGSTTSSINDSFKITTIESIPFQTSPESSNSNSSESSQELIKHDSAKDVSDKDFIDILPLPNHIQQLNTKTPQIKMHQPQIIPKHPPTKSHQQPTANYYSSKKHSSKWKVKSMFNGHLFGNVLFNKKHSAKRKSVPNFSSKEISEPKITRSRASTITSTVNHSRNPHEIENKPQTSLWKKLLGFS